MLLRMNSVSPANVWIMPPAIRTYKSSAEESTLTASSETDYE